MCGDSRPVCSEEKWTLDGSGEGCVLTNLIEQRAGSLLHGNEG